METRLQQIQAMLRANRLADAEGASRRWTAANPADARARATLGNVLRRSGRPAEALVELKIALARDPAMATAWKDAALAGLGIGDQTVALDAARELCRIQPNDALSWFMLGHVLNAFDRIEEAGAVLARVRDVPGAADTRISLALETIGLNRPDAAIRHAEAATHWAPSSALAWSTLGRLHSHAGDHAKALDALRIAAKLAPRDKDVLSLYDTTLSLLRRIDDELVEVRQRLLALDPQSSEVREKLAVSLVHANRNGEAMAILKQMRHSSASALFARWLQFHTQEQPGFRSIDERAAWLVDWEKGLSEFEAIPENAKGLPEVARKILTSVPNFGLAYLGEAHLDLHRRHARVVRRLLDAACDYRLVDKPRREIGMRRRRIGVISSCLHQHSVTRAWAGALLALPRADFELCIFYPGLSEDWQVQRFRERADRFVSGNADFATWKQRLDEADLDVAIFLDIGLDVINQSLAAVRHAAVQVATWAHPVSTGADQIDYFLSADGAEPADADQHYSETLHRLPNLGACFAAPEPFRAAPSKTDKAAHLMCVQNLFKLQPEHDRLFARIAAGAPEARFSILTSATAQQGAVFSQRLHRQLKDHGVDPARFRILGKLAPDAYASELSSADVLLDSIGFSGGITTLDSLWMDKLVVTLPGALMRGRQTFAMLKRIGLTETIAADPDDYVDRAIALTQDANYRDTLCRKLGENKHTLYEDRAVCTAFADFLRTVEPPEFSRH